MNSLHDFATRLYLVEDQPAWSPSLRSKTTLVQMPKRHLADPDLAAALLGASPETLLMDSETMGIFFESLMVHDLLVYTQSLHARGVYHLRDMKARKKIGAIIEFCDGSWIGFEAKPSHHNIDQAAANLLRVSAGVTRDPSAPIVVIPPRPCLPVT